MDQPATTTALTPAPPPSLPGLGDGGGGGEVVTSYQPQYPMQPYQPTPVSQYGGASTALTPFGSRLPYHSPPLVYGQYPGINGMMPMVSGLESNLATFGRMSQAMQMTFDAAHQSFSALLRLIESVWMMRHETLMMGTAGSLTKVTHALYQRLIDAVKRLTGRYSPGTESDDNSGEEPKVNWIVVLLVLSLTISTARLIARRMRSQRAIEQSRFNHYFPQSPLMPSTALYGRPSTGMALNGYSSYGGMSGYGGGAGYGSGMYGSQSLYGSGGYGMSGMSSGMYGY